jgi:hypothetical protein
MRRLMIDDVRIFRMIFDECNVTSMSKMQADPKYVFKEVRNYGDGIRALRDDDPWDELYLDNDLGRGGSGYEVLNWLEEPENRCFIPKTIIIISGNADAAKRMKLTCDAWVRNGFAPDGFQCFRSWVC